MSERAAAFGALNPPKTIEHKGKTYSVAPVLTEGTLLKIEEKLYDRAKAALKASRDLYTPDEFAAEVGKLREQHQAGAFAFNNPNTLEHLQTDAGAVLLLSCMMGADLGEALLLLTERGDELREMLDEAVELSFPKGTAPRPKAARSKNRKR